MYYQNNPGICKIPAIMWCKPITQVGAQFNKDKETSLLCIRVSHRVKDSVFLKLIFQLLLKHSALYLLNINVTMACYIKVFSQ